MHYMELRNHRGRGKVSAQRNNSATKVQLCSLIQVFLGRELLVLSTLHVASVSVK
jgi:hypothetical protein